MSKENKKYKYQIFYLKKDGSLYAYTDSKKLAKSFMEQRNLNKFYTKKVTLDKEGISYLAREYQNQILIEKMYFAFIRDKRRMIRFPWVVTAAEDLMVNSYISQATINIYNSAWYPINIFNDELQRALRELRYDVCNNYIGANDWNKDYKNNDFVGFIEEDVAKYNNTSQSDEDDAIVLDESYILFKTIGRTL